MNFIKSMNLSNLRPVDRNNTPFNPSFDRNDTFTLP